MPHFRLLASSNLRSTLLGALILLLFLCAYSATAVLRCAHAQQDDFAREARTFSTWYSNISSMFRGLEQVIEHAGELDELSLSLIDDEVDEQFARRMGKRILARGKALLDDETERMSCCLEKPKFKTNRFAQSSRDIAALLPVTRDQTSDLLDDSEALFAAALRGEKIDMALFDKRAIDRAVFMFNATSVALESQRLSMNDPSHPNYHLLSAVVHGNNAMVAILSGDQGEPIGQARRELEDMRKDMGSGRAATWSLRKKIEELPASGSSGSRMLEWLESVIRNFEMSFDVEEDMVEVIYTMSASPKTVSEIELYDKAFLDFDLLNRRRAALEEKRMSLLREFPQ